MGRVEFKMLLFVDAMGGLEDPPLEALFDEYSGKTFGPRVEWFKKYCDHYVEFDDQKEALKKIYKVLDELLPKRNYIVHGETWEGTFEGNPRQPYRVGLVKKNLEYLDEFERAEHGPSVFDVHQVRIATKLCLNVLAALADFRAKIPVSSEPFHEEPNDLSQWPPPTR
jgi:hypothetical protein